MGHAMTDTNWVEARAQCTPRAVFATVKKRVEADAAEINEKISEQRRRNKAVRIHPFPSSDQGFHVCWTPISSPSLIPDDGNIIFERGSNGKFLVRMPSGGTREIGHRWDKEKTSCVLQLDGEAKELWQISQDLLLDFFFERILEE